MEHNRRHFRTNTPGSPTRTDEEENQTTGNINKQQPNQSGQKKHKNCRYKKPNLPITNLSNHKLSKHQITLLTKGLNFIPTQERITLPKYFRIYHCLIEKSDSSITFTKLRYIPKHQLNRTTNKYNTTSQVSMVPP